MAGKTSDRPWAEGFAIGSTAVPFMNHPSQIVGFVRLWAV
jgi:hypothetical protein